MGVVLLGCFFVAVLFSAMWGELKPQIDNAIAATSPQGVKVINNLGDSFFYYTQDTMLTLLYFGLVLAVFISALYENANPESFALGLLFIIPLIIVTFSLSDLAHAFYSVQGLAGVKGYFTSTEYIMDYLPVFTAIFSLGYLIFLATKKNIFKGAPSGSGIYSG